MRRRRMLAAGIAVVAAAAVFAAVGFGRRRSSVPFWAAGQRSRLRHGGFRRARHEHELDPVADDWTACSRSSPATTRSSASCSRGLEQKTGLSWTNDVQPALGPEVDVAVLPTASGGKPDAVLLTQPSDPANFAALLQKLSASGGPAPVSAQAGGWTVRRRQPGGGRRCDRGDGASRLGSRLPGRERAARAERSGRSLRQRSAGAAAPVGSRACGRRQRQARLDGRRRLSPPRADSS